MAELHQAPSYSSSLAVKPPDESLIDSELLPATGARLSVEGGVGWPKPVTAGVRSGPRAELEPDTLLDRNERGGQPAALLKRAGRGAGTAQDDGRSCSGYRIVYTRSWSIGKLMLVVR